MNSSHTQRLHIVDEFSPLKSVVVCWAEHVPRYEDYKTEDPEFTKFHPYVWDKDFMLRQQDAFFTLLQRYGVELVFPKTDPSLPFQMYTRDTAFVIGEKMYYAGLRKYGDRNGEIAKMIERLALPADQVVSLHGEIEGGDVVVTGKESCFLGQTSRTNETALHELSQHVSVKPFALGERVMHLDTRLVILPRNIALIDPAVFSPEDLVYLQRAYTLIEVHKDEVKKLGTNVFVINPETIVVPMQHTRIADQLRHHGFSVETVDYTEPINLGGSFRCTTMPLVRER